MRAWWLALVVATLSPGAVAQDDDASRIAQRKAAQAKLESVRAEITALSAKQQATEVERGSAVAALREKDLALAKIAGEVRDLDTRIEEQQGKLTALQGERTQLDAALATQRDALARLLRSAYALGYGAELKLLLEQEDFPAIARALAYHRYFENARVEKIDGLSKQLADLAAITNRIAKARDAIAAARADRAAEAARQQTARDDQAAQVARFEATLKDQAGHAAALGKDEKSLERLIEQLRDIFADIPKRLAGDVPFASERGRLAWPVKGPLLAKFDTGSSGGSGWLIGAPPGTPVRAVAHGRVVFADWLRGYGLLLIVDHGDGYLSLYGGNEALLKSVGDWVDAGDVIATSGASGGQKQPGVWFELRSGGRAIDPKGWLR